MTLAPSPPSRLALARLALLALCAASSGCFSTSTYVRVRRLSDVSVRVASFDDPADQRVLAPGAPRLALPPLREPMLLAPMPPVALVRTPYSIDLECPNCSGRDRSHTVIEGPELVFDLQHGLDGQLQRTGQLLGYPAAGEGAALWPARVRVSVLTDASNVREVHEVTGPSMTTRTMFGTSFASIGGGAALGITEFAMHQPVYGGLFEMVAGIVWALAELPFMLVHDDRVVYRGTAARPAPPAPVARPTVPAPWALPAPAEPSGSTDRPSL